MNTLQRATAFVITTVTGLIPVAALAQTALVGQGLNKAATGPYGKAPDPSTLPSLVGRFIGVAFDLFGILLLCYLLYGGYLWLTAAGDGKKVDAAKDTIKNAIIGVVILVSANFIAAYVLGQIGSAFSTGP